MLRIICIVIPQQLCLCSKNWDPGYFETYLGRLWAYYGVFFKEPRKMHFLQIACGNDDKYRSECWNSWRGMWRICTICCLSRFDPFFKIYGLDVVCNVFVSFSWRYPIFTISHDLCRYHSLPLKFPYIHCFENFLTVWLLHFWISFHVLGSLLLIVTPCSLINDYGHFSRTSFLSSHIVR
jgi:hypothetical protein